MDRTRDVQQNLAFFLGAFGTALGVIGGAMSGLGILAWLLPDFAQTAPDWFFALFVIAFLAVMIGAWPALDWLLNSRPSFGAPCVAAIGMVLIAEGLVAIICTAWGFTGWLAVAGGAIMLPAAQLAVLGGGTEPLTWRSLRTGRVQATETRADRFVGAVIALTSLGALISPIFVFFEALANDDWLTLLVLAVLGLGGFGWLGWRWLRG